MHKERGTVYPMLYTQLAHFAELGAFDLGAVGEWQCRTTIDQESHTEVHRFLLLG